MQISKRSFPHPVLAPFSDDIEGCDFQCALNPFVDGPDYRLDAFAKVSNEELRQLVESKDAVYAIHVQCPATRYRTLQKFTEPEYSFRIPAERLDGRFQVNAFILAERSITYSNNDFHQDYEGATFSVRKGDILAVEESRTYYAEKMTDALRQIPSIFTIAKNTGLDASAIDVDAQGHKIVVLLSPPNYDYYLQLRQVQGLHPILNTKIVFPALIYILDLINPENNGGGSSDREDLRWYQVLRRKLADLGVRLETGDPFTDSSVKLASRLIGEPVSEAIMALSSLVDID